MFSGIKPGFKYMIRLSKKKKKKKPNQAVYKKVER